MMRYLNTALREDVGLASHLMPVPEMDDPALRLNPPEQLAPVGCWLLLHVSGELVHGRRTSHVQKKGREMEYQLADGTHVTGKFWWTAP